MQIQAAEAEGCGFPLPLLPLIPIPPVTQTIMICVVGICWKALT